PGDLLAFLAEKNSVRLLGPREANARAPTVALVTRERGEDVAAKLAARGIMCGGGNFYGVRCLEAQGVDPDHGALRVSFVHYTSEQEVAKLMEALEGAV
ncbi:MAG TPA: nitrogen fixation protein NifS, partial [Hyphomonadaceae bacterium]|nr:nitrogen fixation protein NifS [Hyphomonadaceae bacterium]